ncbi:hypothetical protein [Sediminivirga luteola]|uniref:hypothetical protein n=1 Tax=Sediminivirga luteola TaxID=1774748 RepID=UPI003BB5AD99
MIAMTGMAMTVPGVSGMARVGIMIVVGARSLAVTLVMIVVAGVRLMLVVIRVLGVRVRSCRGIVAHRRLLFHPRLLRYTPIGFEASGKRAVE